MNMSHTVCQIEHHAMMFAFLSKHAIRLCGNRGKDAILDAMTKYGKERGRRMALNAQTHGDPLNTMTNQAYGEWKPDYPGQMEFGQLCTEPTLQTYISKCAWCEAWQKHHITEYGKYYCVNVDNAVYQGFRPDFTCTPISTSMSWGGDCCKFDWGHPLSAEDNEALAAKEKGTWHILHERFQFPYSTSDAHPYPRPDQTVRRCRRESRHTGSCRVCGYLRSGISGCVGYHLIG